MSCDNLCTAAKCQELEERIDRLEQIVDLLQASFEAHVSQAIPVAHDYEPPEPEVTVSLALEGNTLKVFVKVGSKSGDETIELPKYDPEVGVSLAVAGNDLKVFVEVGEKNDSETIALPKYEPDVNLAVFELGKNSFGISIDIGDKHAQDNFVVNVPEPIEPKPVTISGSASYYDETLTITVATPDDSDTFQTSIPRDNSGGGCDCPEPLPGSISGSASYYDEILTITVATDDGQTTFQTLIPAMDNALLEQILDYTSTIYKILGGGVWEEAGTGTSKTVSLRVKPESKIKEFGAQLYTQNSPDLNQLTATNLLDLNNIYEAVNYYRNGFHRLPAKTLKSLINSSDGDQEITIYDTFSWQEYLIKQIDALVGEFPIKIKYESSEGNEELKLDNISVALAEILALNLNIAYDSDVAVNVGMKALVEARNAANAEIVAVDYSKANAEYLGYKGNQKERSVNCTFNPKGTNLKDTLKPTTQKIVGWKNEDSETLIEIIKKTLVGTEIIKAALFHPYEEGGAVTGDGIADKQEGERTTDNLKWESFKQRINIPGEHYQVPGPKAKLKDLTIENDPTP